MAERTNEVFKWKEEIKRAIEAMTEEIGLLEMQRKRLSQAKNVLSLVRSISSECLACRALRQGHDLTRDNPEEELIKVSFKLFIKIISYRLVLGYIFIWQTWRPQFGDPCSRLQKIHYIDLY